MMQRGGMMLIYPYVLFCSLFSALVQLSLFVATSLREICCSDSSVTEVLPVCQWELASDRKN